MDVDCPVPSGGWPMLITMHGAGSTMTHPAIVARAMENAARGYIAVIFTWRGFVDPVSGEGSEGMYELEHTREWEDLNDVTARFVNDYNAYGTPPADIIDEANIGVEGTSMGAAHSWLGATQSWQWPYPYRSVAP